MAYQCVGKSYYHGSMIGLKLKRDKYNVNDQHAVKVVDKNDGQIFFIKGRFSKTSASNG